VTGFDLRILRISLSWSQARLASESGVCQPNISMIETGRLRPTREMLDRLTRALGASAADTEERPILARPIDPPSAAEDLVSDGLATHLEGQQYLHVGRTQWFRLLADHELAYVLIGTKRLVPWRELHRFAAARLVGVSDRRPEVARRRRTAQVRAGARLHVAGSDDG